jgi:hypothetical protein
MCIRVLVTKPAKKRPLGRSRKIWEDNNKMDLLEVGWRGMNWVDLAQDRNKGQPLVTAVMKIPVPQNTGNFLIR